MHKFTESVPLIVRASLKFTILTPKNGLTVLISHAVNQIDYHACNSSAPKQLQKLGVWSMAVKATNLCDGVKSFFCPQIRN